MKRKLIIAVVGHDSNAKEIHVKTAEEVGREIAKKKGIVVCGGKSKGVANAVAKGAEELGGVSVGILPASNSSETSEHISIPILTGINFARNQILAFSADAVIVIGGGVGTLTEVAYAYYSRKPIVVINGLGGLSQQFIGKYMDEKKAIKIVGANSAKGAVDLAFKLIKSG